MKLQQGKRRQTLLVRLTWEDIEQDSPMMSLKSLGAKSVKHER